MLLIKAKKLWHIIVSGELDNVKDEDTKGNEWGSNSVEDAQAMGMVANMISSFFFISHERKCFTSDTLSYQITT